SSAAWKSCFSGLGSHFTVCAMSRSRHGLPDVLGHVVQRDRDGGARGAVGEFGVAELDARPDLPVVHDDLGTGIEQRLVDLLSRGGHGGVLLLGDHHHDLERGDRDRPDDALVVVVDLDGRGHGALDADAVAAHDRLDRLAVRAGHPDIHGVGVLVAKLEDVPDLDAALYLQAVPAVDAGVAGCHLAQAGPPAHGDVALDVHAAQVGVVGVGAGEHAAPAAPRLIAQGLVGDDRVTLRR